MLIVVQGVPVPHFYVVYEPASLLVVPLGKALSGIPHLDVVGRWPATPKRARYSALIVFL